LQINVNFDIGTPLDLIDREIYQPDIPLPKHDASEAEKSDLKKRLDELKLTHFDEKDRFILSDANVYQTPSKPGATQSTNINMPKKLPAVWRLV
jgi:hypothetical protein